MRGERVVFVSWAFLMVACIEMLGSHVFPISSRSVRITTTTTSPPPRTTNTTKMSYEYEQLPDSPLFANSSYKGIPRNVDSAKKAKAEEMARWDSPISHLQQPHASVRRGENAHRT
ncbi:hypothetical protein K440DRAFT_264725 [Wilcoxina mikolae CBS 423.85]|nr:hypothetical protein K440DRAFT_264725 [Wilcoxina mikolae CBS 423.85]